MKPRNFPARKVRRQMMASKLNFTMMDIDSEMRMARQIRSKKRRAG